MQNSETQFKRLYALSAACELRSNLVLSAFSGRLSNCPLRAYLMGAGRWRSGNRDLRPSSPIAGLSRDDRRVKSHRQFTIEGIQRHANRRWRILKSSG